MAGRKGMAWRVRHVRISELVYIMRALHTGRRSRRLRAPSLLRVRPGTTRRQAAGSEVPTGCHVPSSPDCGFPTCVVRTPLYPEAPAGLDRSAGLPGAPSPGRSLVIFREPEHRAARERPAAGWRRAAQVALHRTRRRTNHSPRVFADDDGSPQLAAAGFDPPGRPVPILWTGVHGLA
jgi:hypothetical protein